LRLCQEARKPAESLFSGQIYLFEETSLEEEEVY
jgi:hypothetical protein